MTIVSSHQSIAPPQAATNEDSGTSSFSQTEYASRNIPLPTLRRTDPLYLVNEQVKLAQRLLSGMDHLEYQGSQSPLNISLNSLHSSRTHGMNHESLLTSQAKALLHAHHMSNVLRATDRYSQIDRFGLPGATSILRQDPIEPNSCAATDLETNPSAGAPPVIFTNNSDDEGHWIFYPIKVPNLRCVGAGWKLALLPIDGKGEPIELDPTILRFQKT